MFEVAKTGKVSRLYVLFRKMRTNKSRPVTPNLNSYAAVLQAFGCRLENEIADEAADQMVVEEAMDQSAAQNKTNKSIAAIRLGIERVLWDIKKANVIYFKKNLFILLIFILFFLINF